MITGIKLERAEGLISECRTVTFTGSPYHEGPDSDLSHAETQLQRWSWSAPEYGKGYHKVYITVTHADGKVCKDRFDLVHPDVEYVNLTKWLTDRKFI